MKHHGFFYAIYTKNMDLGKVNYVKKFCQKTDKLESCYMSVWLTLFVTTATKSTTPNPGLQSLHAGRQLVSVFIPQWNLQF